MTAHFGRLLRNASDQALLMQGSNTEYRNGVLMYTAPILVAQKFEMLDLPEPRLRAKDRYDIAWWISERIEHVRPRLRIELDRRLRESPALRDSWDQNHRADRILRNIDAGTVHAVLATELDRDPMVLQDRWPDGELILHVNEGPATILSFSCNNDSRDEVLIAEFRTDQELEKFMRRIGAWQPDDIPEQLKEITLERQRASDATMGSKR